MKIGVMLPTFRENVADALAVAEQVERHGLDGVFAFDHLWPMGSPTRPALAPFPVLAAVATTGSTLYLGPLVARVGLVGTSHLVEQFATLEALAPRRVIAALGTGDRLSDPEQRAYDLEVRSSDARRALLDEALSALRDKLAMVPLWCGAGAPATNALARRHGAAINVWGGAPSTLRELALGGEVNWAGDLGENASGALDALADAGATWAIVSTPQRIPALGEWRRSH